MTKMVHRAFGPTGVRLPVIGQGTWNMERDDRRTAIEALVRGIDAGMTHIDTAELYGDGRVEVDIVRQAITGRRAEVFLVSKVLPTHASRDGVVKACEASLRRLGTDYLDCYLLHWPGSFPLSETVAGFDRLVSDGKIRSWGVSNFDELQLAELIHLAGAHQIACNQVLYHLQERRVEHAVIPLCEKNRIATVAYSPFGSGRFPSVTSAAGKVLREIARSHRASPYQVALAFLTRRPGLFAIPKASQPDHALDNAAAAQVELQPQDVSRIDEAFPVGDPSPGIPTL